VRHPQGVRDKCVESALGAEREEVVQDTGQMRGTGEERAWMPNSLRATRIISA